MIGATAQGIRLAQSKLRYHIQDSSFLNISVVRGKEMWRLTGAHELEHKKNTRVHLKILKLLKRLLHGEEKNDKLFEIIEELYKTDIKEEDYEIVECLTVLRILNTLGYIRNNGQISIFLGDNKINAQIIEQLKAIKSMIVNTINSALKESHL